MAFKYQKEAFTIPKKGAFETHTFWRLNAKTGV